MFAGDTSLGGQGKGFPNTTWSMVLRFGAASPDQQRRAVEELTRKYWKPIYHFLRVAWARTNDDAKDLTQDFFAWLLEGGVLQRYRPEKGGFRAFLKMVLNGFVSNELRAANRIKRGRSRTLSLDGMESGDNLPAASDAKDPEVAFDRAWMAQIVNDAVARARRRCLEGGKKAALEIFEAYDGTGAEERPTYDQLAAKHGMTQDKIDSQLSIVRRMVREEIRAEVERLTSDDRELEEELNALFGLRDPHPKNP